MRKRIGSMGLSLLLLVSFLSLLNFNARSVYAEWWEDLGLPSEHYGIDNDTLVGEYVIMYGFRAYNWTTYYGGFNTSMGDEGADPPALHYWTNPDWDTITAEGMLIYFNGSFLDGNKITLNYSAIGTVGSVLICITYNNRSGSSGVFNVNSTTDFLIGEHNEWSTSRVIISQDEWNYDIFDLNETNCNEGIDPKVESFTIDLENLTDKTEVVALNFIVTDTAGPAWSGIRLYNISIGNVAGTSTYWEWDFTSMSNSSIKYVGTDSLGWFDGRHPRGDNPPFAGEDVFCYIDSEVDNDLWINGTYLSEFAEESGETYEPNDNFVPEFVQLIEHRTHPSFATFAKWDINLPAYDMWTGSPMEYYAYRGSQYMMMEFNASWLDGKILNITGNYDVCDVSSILLIDGSYDRTSATDFPDGSGYPYDGAGILESYKAMPAGSGGIDVDTVIDASSATLEKVTLVVEIHDYDLSDYSNVSMELIAIGNGTHYLWTFDPDGFWLADVVFPEGNRGNTNNEYGYIEYKNGYNGIYIHEDYLLPEEEEEEEEDDDLLSDETLEDTWNLLTGLFPLIMIMLLLGAMMGKDKKKGAPPTSGSGGATKPQTQTYRFEHYKYE